MDSTEFEKHVRETVAKIENDRDAEKCVEPNDVFIVWMCKTLQNNKALASTLVGYYYELTYNGDRGEMYIDVYKKIMNKTQHYYTAI